MDKECVCLSFVLEHGSEERKMQRWKEVLIYILEPMVRVGRHRPSRHYILAF